MNTGSPRSTSPCSGDSSASDRGDLGHQPVLYHQIIEVLNPVSEGKYIDGTVGAGGHACGILQGSSPNGLLLGLDLDQSALALAAQKLSAYGNRSILVNRSYTAMDEEAEKLGWQGVDGILLDLGLSSMQLDQPERGFSFRADAPLDMRFDSSSAGVTAADLVNTLPEADLADLIWRYGEENKSRRIARAIDQNRPVNTTGELASIIQSAAGKPRSDIHPATRTFQALRIAVNGELDNVSQVLPKAIKLLKPGGRLAVISFHSLEDRIVKQYFHTESKDCICQPDQLICTCHHQASIRELTRKPLTASTEEAIHNPRSRSAKLRVAEKLGLA